MAEAHASQAAGEAKRIELENEKLALEVSRLRHAPAWYSSAKLLSIIPVLLSVAGFVWGVWWAVHQYKNEQAKDREEREMRSLREKETAEREAMRPILESQRATYLEALNAASAIAYSRAKEERAQAEVDFWKLYQGRMILIETMEVSGAMVDVGRCLTKEDQCSGNELSERIRTLGTAMAGSMAESATLNYKQFADRQFKYSSEVRKQETASGSRQYKRSSR